MPINIYSVANHLKQEGWHLISDSYKNLDTELEMECPKHHKQWQTYKQWRKHPTCDKCLAGNTTRINKEKIPTKKIDARRILALDAATVTTGYAIYDDDVLVYYGTYKVDGNWPTERRINEIKKWLAQLLEKYDIDFVGIENIQLQNQNHVRMSVEVYRTLANLQGVLLDTVFEACVDHDLVYSSSWRKYCNVGDDKGRENKKKAAQEKVKLWYNQDCTQDEADAICIGKYFVHLLKQNKSSWGEDI